MHIVIIVTLLSLLLLPYFCHYAFIAFILCHIRYCYIAYCLLHAYWLYAISYAIIVTYYAIMPLRCLLLQLYTLILRAIRYYILRHYAILIND